MDPLKSSSQFQQNVTNFFTKADKVADHIPVVSFASNSVNIFQKMVLLPLLNKFSPGTIEKNHYLTHIQDKKVSDCILFMIPGAAAFTYLGKKGFSNANKHLDKELGNKTTTESVAKKEESIKQSELPKAASSSPMIKKEKKQKDIAEAAPSALDPIEVEDKIEKERLEFISQVENLTVELGDHVHQNSVSYHEAKTQLFSEEGFNSPVDSSSHLKMEDFVEKFNTVVNPRLKAVNELKENKEAISSFKSIVQKYSQENIPLPFTDKQRSELTFALTEQSDYYFKVGRDLDSEYEFGKIELEKFQSLLEKKEYPCIVPNILSFPSFRDRSDMKIENESDLIMLKDAYSKYVANLGEAKNKMIRMAIDRSDVNNSIDPDHWSNYGRNI